MRVNTSRVHKQLGSHSQERSAAALVKALDILARWLAWPARASGKTRVPHIHPLTRPEKRLGDGIIVTVPGAAHAHRDADFGKSSSI
jgi:hypothetical protein